MSLTGKLYTCTIPILYSSKIACIWLSNKMEKAVLLCCHILQNSFADRILHDQFLHCNGLSFNGWEWKHGIQWYSSGYFFPNTLVSHLLESTLNKHYKYRDGKQCQINNYLQCGLLSLEEFWRQSMYRIALISETISVLSTISMPNFKTFFCFGYYHVVSPTGK